MKNKRFLLLIALMASFTANAQLGFIFSAEAGFAGSTVKTNELPVFLTSYNEANAANGLTKQFVMQQGLATGRYFNFMVGMGGKITKMTLGFGRYLVNTPHNEARYFDGSGRDIWTEVKDASTEVGIRCDFKRFSLAGQMILSLRTVSIYSQYVFPDDSRSFGADHTLNGVYEDFNFGPGLGANVSFRVIPTLYLIAHADYIFTVGRSHPEYHQFDDLQDFRTAQNYLPRDVNMYVTDPFNGSGNSISNDIHGLRFGIGVQFYLSSFDFE